jgi:hypothetical protein
LQEELDVFMESEDANYDRFSDCLAARRRQAAEQAAPPPAKSIGKSLCAVHVTIIRNRIHISAAECKSLGKSLFLQTIKI